MALHAGSAPALLVAARRHPWPAPPLLALTLIPAALAGLAFERLVEERLGGARPVALAQLLGGAMLVLADGAPARRLDANPLDHLAVGLAQALALAPGVSRAGAALTAARLRGLGRPAAVRLSLHAALPVTIAAGALKGARMPADPPPRELRAALAAGCAAALASSLCSLPLLGLLERRRFLRCVGWYRVALGAGTLARLRPP